MFRAIAPVLALAVLSGCSIMPDGNRQSRQSTRPAQPTYVPSAQARQCLTALGATQASFTPLPDQFYGSGCSTLNTVRLASLQSDDANLALTNLGPVACPLANTFAGWARYGVDRAARAYLGSPLVRIETFGSYSCRNVAGSGRRSAHATANAIDVAAFVLANGERISVKEGWKNGSSRQRQFLQVVHESACKRFGTVLGPAYNAAHEDHFHLEESGQSFCR